MSQAASYGVSESGPQTPTAHAQENNDTLDALLSQHSGSSRPPYAVASTIWVDVVSGTEENTYYFDGTDDILIQTINPTANTITFSGLFLLTGKMTADDNEIERPKFKDYSETVNAIGSIGGGTQDIDLELGNVVTATVDTSTTTFTFSNPPTTGSDGSFTLKLTNGGSQTINWPAAVDWPGGTAPTLTTSGRDVLVFTTDDAGTTWDGFAAGLDQS